MNMRNIVQLVFTPKLVLNVELLKKTIIAHVQNVEYVDHFTSFLFIQCLGGFSSRLRKLLGKSKSV